MLLLIQNFFKAPLRISPNIEGKRLLPQLLIWKSSKWNSHLLAQKKMLMLYKNCLLYNKANPSVISYQKSWTIRGYIGIHLDFILKTLKFLIFIKLHSKIFLLYVDCDVKATSNTNLSFSMNLVFGKCSTHFLCTIYQCILQCGNTC